MVYLGTVLCIFGVVAIIKNLLVATAACQASRAPFSSFPLGLRNETAEGTGIGIGCVVGIGIGIGIGVGFDTSQHPVALVLPNLSLIQHLAQCAETKSKSKGHEKHRKVNFVSFKSRLVALEGRKYLRVCMSVSVRLSFHFESAFMK